MVNIDNQITEAAINRTVDLILKNNGEIPYDLIEDVLGDSPNYDWDYLDTYSICLFMSMIAYHIPIYVNGERTLRPLDRAFISAQVFRFANRDEQNIIHTSWKLPNQVLPNLNHLDIKSNIFKAGTGTSMPDLVNESNLQETYEVKFEYDHGSVSSLHKATYLLDCSPTSGVTVYSIINNRKGEFIRNIPEITIAERKGHYWVKSLAKPDLDLLLSGNLIPIIDQHLAQSGFT